MQINRYAIRVGDKYLDTYGSTSADENTFTDNRPKAFWEKSKEVQQNRLSIVRQWWPGAVLESFRTEAE
jgi:hypothetical protein